MCVATYDASHLCPAFFQRAVEGEKYLSYFANECRSAEAEKNDNNIQAHHQHCSIRRNLTDRTAQKPCEAKDGGDERNSHHSAFDDAMAALVKPMFAMGNYLSKPYDGMRQADGVA